MSEREAFDSIHGLLTEVLAQRPGNPAFRMLCAVLNHHFNEWDRMVIIERLGFTDYEYGFIVVAHTKTGIQAVTNLRLGEWRQWEDSVDLYELTVNSRQYESVLEELDKVRSDFPQPLFWVENVDYPLYVLRDIRSDGTAFTYGVCGETQIWISPKEPALSFSQAADIVRNVGTETLYCRSPRGQKMLSAGRTYATLLAKAWQATLGEPDREILGLPANKE
jgi:hypothetical protein